MKKKSIGKSIRNTLDTSVGVVDQTTEIAGNTVVQGVQIVGNFLTRSLRTIEKATNAAMDGIDNIVDDVIQG